MANQEKRFRNQQGRQDENKLNDPSEEFQQYKQQSGSRITEAEESREPASSRNEDLETLDDEDEDDIY